MTPPLIHLPGPLSGLISHGGPYSCASYASHNSRGVSLVLVAIIDLCIHYYNFLAIDNVLVCTKSSGGLVGKAVTTLPSIRLHSRRPLLGLLFRQSKDTPACAVLCSPLPWPYSTRMCLVACPRMSLQVVFKYYQP